MTATVEADAAPEATETATEAKEPKQRGRKAEPRDFTVWKEDHESLANYINEHYEGVDITPGQVKAVFLIRGEWSNTPERVAAREEAARQTAEEKELAAQRKREREAEKAKYANETPEEKEARKEREKVIKQADRAAKRAAELAAKAEELKAKAAEVDGTESDPEAEFEGVTEDATEEATEAPEAESDNSGSEEVSKPKRTRKRPSA